MRLTLSAVALFVALGMVTIGVPADAKKQTSSGGNVTYRPAGEATLKYNDGVVVHRHADGSVEVTDPETVEPLYPSQSTTRRVVHKRVAKKATAVKKTSTSTATKKTK